jgi:uncharacterized protein
MDKIIEQLDKHKEKYPNEAPGLHGGEPLLLKNEDIRTLFSEMESRWPDQSYHIQSNGTLIDDDIIDIFEDYSVGVGISCDGPPELNSERKAAGERGEDAGNATNNMSQTTNESIRRIAESDVYCGVITVLHKTNAGTDEKFETLLDWIDELNQMGVYGHFNPAIPYEDVQEDISLSPNTLADRYIRTWEWMKEESYRMWNPMRNMVDNLLGLTLTNCVNTECDVFNAGAAKIIKGDGGTTGCGKTWSTVGDGVPFLQGIENESEYDKEDARYRSLKQTPGKYTDGEPDMGGCKGCKYWQVCKGGCPSSGINDDYRNRTIWCDPKYKLYQRIENDLRSLLPNIKLITDYKWDMEISEDVSRQNLDIKPFGAMRNPTSGPSSSFQEHARSPDTDHIAKSFDMIRKDAEKKYDESVLTINEEEETIHADSGMVEWDEVDK